MKKIIRTLLAICLLLISTRPLFGQSMAIADRKSTPEIVVYVHDYVQMSQETLMRAEEVASEILRRAGVEVIWINCDFTIPSERREPGCARPLSYVDFVLNIVDRIQTLSPKLSQIAMGVAAVASEAGQGDTAYLGMRQAATVAHVASVPLETVLGLGAAHELGHLLLGENAHSRSGLMKARWGAGELNPDSRENLIFLPEQADRIRTNLLTRQKKMSNSTIAIQFEPSAGDGPQTGPNCSSCSSMPITTIIGSY